MFSAWARVQDENRCTNYILLGDVVRIREHDKDYCDVFLRNGDMMTVKNDIATLMENVRKAYSQSMTVYLDGTKI